MDARPQFILPPVLDPLKDYQNWVPWRWEQNEKGELKKPPFIPRPPERKASVSNPQTWGSFEEAMQALSSGLFDGLGFTFLGTKILSFDLDDCRNPETGVVLPEALRTVHKLQTYTEISPSGKGLKLFGTGYGAKIHKKLKVPNSSMSMEFWRDCERYSTVTGIVLPGTEHYPLADVSVWMDWFVSYLERANELFKTLPEDIREALDFNTKGERSEKFFGVVLWLHDQGWSVDDIGMLLTGTPVAEKYEKEGKNRLRKEIERAISNSDPQGGRTADEGVLVTQEASEIEPEALDWLWKGWFAKGYLNLIAGETGAGKDSILSSVISCLTTGSPLPGETEKRDPKRVLFLGSEDGLRNVTIPRLIACGADRGNVTIIHHVERKGKANTFSLKDDIELVRRKLAEARRRNRPYDVFIINPLTSYFGSHQTLRVADIGRTAHVRSILEPWLRLSEEHELATIGVTHFMKDTTRKMLHRVMESSAFTELCRSLVAVVATEDTSEAWAKAMLQVKTNLPDHPGGAWRFVTERVELEKKDKKGKVVAATRVVWREFDQSLTEKTAVGPSRGPKSQYTHLFGFWVKTYFNVAKSEWLLVDDVRGAALRENIVSDRWWKDHSSEYLEKKNENGVWMCRLKKGAEWKGAN